MSITTSEFVWSRQLLKDFNIYIKAPTLLLCDNDAALQIAINLTFHERAIYIQIGCHFVLEKVVDKTIKLLPIRSSLQLADKFTKPLPSTKLQPFVIKMGSKNVSILRGNITESYCNLEIKDISVS